ncbi:MAG: sulfite exporter TauE/SafE family protein [Candidatus Eisenbacteria sp.]|nr:sulfite exporter TauE/SafE family protein [Candidatus Eisenbacteria bacterium]
MTDQLFLLFAGGLLAGALGGLLGIGGGIVLMPMLRFMVGLSPAHAAGTCILAVSFTTLGGSYRHYRLGHVNPRSILAIIVSGALATVVFSLIFVSLTARERWLDLGMGLVFSLVSIRMIAAGIPGFLKERSGESPDSVIGGTLGGKIAIGAAGGMLPGLLGIGTGGVLVPGLSFFLGASIKTAVASSLTCFCFNAFISSAFKLAQGFIEKDVILPICLGTFIGANFGAMLNRRFPPRAIKTIFGFFFSYVSLKFILLFFGVAI